MENETDTQPDIDQQQRQCRAESAHLTEVRHATPTCEDDEDLAKSAPEGDRS